MSCKSNCSCIVCHVRKMRQEKLANGVSWSEILKSEADSPVLSHLLRPCDSYMLELNDKFLPSICRIQDAWRAYQEVRKGVCMDCGAPFKDFLHCPSAITHDGVARCGPCEKCYSNDCPICLESVAPMANDSCITKCGHVFHFECMMRHNLNSSSCPMCRNPLGGEQRDLPHRPQPAMHGQREARIHAEGREEGYEEGLLATHSLRADALRRRENEYQDAYNTLNGRVGFLEELTHEEIAQAEEEEGVYLPQPLTEQEQEEIEMMQLCEDISGDNDLPRFVFNTVNDLQTAVRELEGSRVREQTAYDRGVVDGRAIANEDLALLRAGKESLERQVDIINKELKLLREQLAKAAPTKL